MASSTSAHRNSAQSITSIIRRICIWMRRLGELIEWREYYNDQTFEYTLHYTLWLPYRENRSMIMMMKESAPERWWRVKYSSRVSLSVDVSLCAQRRCLYNRRFTLYSFSTFLSFWWGVMRLGGDDDDDAAAVQSPSFLEEFFDLFFTLEALKPGNLKKKNCYLQIS